MDVEEGIREAIRQQPRVGNNSKTQTPTAQAAEDQSSLQDQDHGVNGVTGSNGKTGLWQKDFDQESSEDHSTRSIVALCGELDCHPVFLCHLHFGDELWEEEPGSQKQSQHGLVVVSQ